MVAITSCAGHVPPFRIPTDVIREQWGGGSKGVRSKAVAARDDNAVTLAASAAEAALDGRSDVGALFFASTTHPYQYGESGPMLLEMLDLPERTHTATMSASARAGMAGVRSALSHAEATGEPALVVASEVPVPEPGTEREKTAGAGAGAVLIEPTVDGGIVLASTANHAKPMLEAWQPPGGSRQSGDDRFDRDVGYVDTTVTAIRRALEAADWETDDIDTVIISQPTPRYPGRVTRELGVDDDAVAASDLARRTGNLGSASPLAVLADAELAPDNRVVVAGYGSGIADAMAFDVVTVPKWSSPTTGPEATLTYVRYLKQTGAI